MKTRLISRLTKSRPRQAGMLLFLEGVMVLANPGHGWGGSWRTPILAQPALYVPKVFAAFVCLFLLYCHILDSATIIRTYKEIKKSIGSVRIPIANMAFVMGLSVALVSIGLLSAWAIGFWPLLATQVAVLMYQVSRSRANGAERLAGYFRVFSHLEGPNLRTFLLGWYLFRWFLLAWALVFSLALTWGISLIAAGPVGPPNVQAALPFLLVAILPVLALEGLALGGYWYLYRKGVYSRTKKTT